jgi:hypothetical protein
MIKSVFEAITEAEVSCMVGGRLLNEWYILKLSITSAIHQFGGVLRLIKSRGREK